MEKIEINKEFETIEELEKYCDMLRQKYIVMVIHSTDRKIDYIMSFGERK